MTVSGTSADHRTLPVPDGLAGERVDAALAQMFGLSRTRAADLIVPRPGAASTAPAPPRATGCSPERRST